MIKNIKGFGEPKFKIKGTEFSITKLPPMVGFEVVENIREALVNTSSKFESGNISSGTDKKKAEEENALLFFKSVLGLPPKFIENLRKDLFRHIEFTGNGVDRGHMTLLENEDMAFQGFEVINIYEVLGRALFVNFSGSFLEITKLFPGAAQFISQRLQKT